MKKNLPLFLVIFFMFFLTIALWQSAQVIVQKDQNERLLQTSGEIVQKIRAALYDDVASLQDLRGFLLAHSWNREVSHQELFNGMNNFMKSTNILNKYTGRKGVGYSEIITEGSKLKSPVLFFSSPLTTDWNTEGFDLMDVAAFKEVASSFEEEQATILYFSRGTKPAAREELVIVLPLFKGWRDRPSFLFMPVDIRDRLEKVFVRTSDIQDPVDFVLTVVDPSGNEKTLYERLGRQIDQGIVHRQQFNVHNINLAIRTQPTKSFYRSADIILPTIVGAVCLVAVIFIFYFLRSTDRHYRMREQNRKELERAYLEITEKSLNLQRLVDMMKAQAGDFEMSNILMRFISLAKSVGGFTSHIVYLNPDASEERLQLVHQVNSGAFNEKEEVRKSLHRQALSKFFSFNLYLTSVDLSGPRFEKEFLSVRPNKDWIALKLCSRSHELIGVLVLVREKSGGFMVKEIESLNTLCTQASLIIENVWLYEKANEASRAKSEFLANMSHEIRTPLNAIIGFSDIIAGAQAGPEIRQAAVHNIRKNGQQLIRIIDDILDLSKIEAGKLPILSKEILLPDLIFEIQSTMALRADQKKIDFKVTYESEIPKKILSDDVRIKQILMNIIGNAVKFTDKGGVHMSVLAQGRRDSQIVSLVFTVMDTGIGIKDVTKKKLFQSFTQGDSSHSRRFGGTGLGLVLSRRLAHEMGGEVELLETRPGVGSTFRVEIKAEQADNEWVNAKEVQWPAGDSAVKEILPHKKAAHILLVEDSEDNQEIFEYFLKMAGHDVDTVDNGNDAVKKAQADHFDLILMDIQIPGMNGKEATTVIRQAGFQKPIVALTAHALPEEIESCVEAGCSGQITKPVTGEELIKAVDYYLN